MPEDCKMTYVEAQKEENAGQVHISYVSGSPLPHTSTLALFSEPAIQSLRERPCTKTVTHAEYPVPANNFCSNMSTYQYWDYYYGVPILETIWYLVVKPESLDIICRLLLR